jgi:ribonucleotide reductase beta subunit family protein with ferritin-like domain
VAITQTDRMSTAPAAEQITYTDLYTRWEKGNWRATEIDFTEDRRHWEEEFDELRRRAALWNYSLFFWGEDSVTDNLSPFIDAAPLEEQKYFLATQQVDEARHSVFFKRFMHEVAGLGSGDIASGLSGIESQLTWGFRRTFDMLDRVTGELRRDPSRTQLAKAITMYHLVVEASLAQPGQHFIEDYLTKGNLLPGFRSGIHNVSQDEQRHIAFGVRMLYDLSREDPEVPEAVAEMLREVVPYATAVFVPPGWDRRYTEVFGATIEEVFEDGIRSLDSKLKAAGMPVESLPGPQPFPTDLPPGERAQRGIALLEAGILGEPNGGVRRSDEAMDLLRDSMRRSVDTRNAPSGYVIEWAFTDADPFHVRVDDGEARVVEGPADDPDLRLRCALQDWADVMGGRADPRRQMLRGRIRPGGSLRGIWQARRVLPRS